MIAADEIITARSWFGPLPQGWTARPIRRVARIINGATPASEVDDNWGGGIVWVTPEDIGTNVSNLASRDLRESRRTLTHKGLESCATQLVPEAALVISIRAPIGYVAIARTELCFNQGCKGLVLASDIVPEYIYYALIAARTELDLLGVGTTFKELSRERLGSVKLPFPPTMKQQKRIAKELDLAVTRMDEQIRILSGSHLNRPGGLLGRMSALLLERRAALIAAAVTGQNILGDTKSDTGRLKEPRADRDAA